MRCIEMPQIYGNYGGILRLIETWDVLKCETNAKTSETNARLIETWDVLKWITSNLYPPMPWLIETWDVLKSHFLSYKRRWNLGLIETWDVFKFCCRSARGYYI